MENERYVVGRNGNCFNWTATEARRDAAQFILDEIEEISKSARPSFATRALHAALDVRVFEMLKTDESDISESVLKAKIQVSEKAC